MLNHPIRTGAQSRAFTLIELLVVISIIVLLISILLPALGTARKAAHTAVSMSNIRQITLALHMYAGDNKGSLPYAYFDETSGYIWPTLITGILDNAGTATMTGYLSDPGVFWSPGRLPWGGDPRTNLRWTRPGYGVNHYGAMPLESDTKNPINLDQEAKAPHGKILLMAEAFRPAHLPNIDGRYDLNGTTGVSGIFTYNRAAVRSYVDGHAAHLDPTDLLWIMSGSGSYDGAWTSTAASARSVAPYYR